MPPNPRPTKILSSLPFPALLPALFKSVPPAGGVKAGRRPPAGLGLDAAEDGTTMRKPGAEQDQIS